VNWLDRELQRRRIRRALGWIPEGARVLDVGCFDGRLLRALGPRLASGVGLDPLLEKPVEHERFRLLPGSFPEDVPQGPFDVITMLAVLEHVAASERQDWVDACLAQLAPGGRVIASIPGPAVDHLLEILMKVRLLHGMEVDQHHGAEPAKVVKAFTGRGFELEAWRRFQLGLNNLVVLRPLPSVRPLR
jgi:2-polyprenyl-3-methyl-5-hydroxy-6-metoxy-1,4-benzoquinol methylase